MRTAAVLFALASFIPGTATAQEWQEFVFQQDGFTVNFPGQPKIEEITWRSQLGYMLPGRVYSAERNNERFSATVVDYSSLEQQGIARWKACPSGNSQCRDGGPTIGPGYWKQDERGAIVGMIAQADLALAESGVTDRTVGQVVERISQPEGSGPGSTRA